MFVRARAHRVIGNDCVPRPFGIKGGHSTKLVTDVDGPTCRLFLMIHWIEEGGVAKLPLPRGLDEYS